MAEVAELAQVDQVVKNYISAYNETDPDLKRRKMEASFARDGRYTSEDGEIGFDRVLEMAGEFHRKAVMEIVGEIRTWNEYAAFRWRFVTHDGSREVGGVDLCEIGPDGRLKNVTVFID